jgi:hypothetical protein
MLISGTGYLIISLIKNELGGLPDINQSLPVPIPPWLLNSRNSAFE